MLSETQSACPYASNKPLNMKFGPILGTQSIFFDIFTFKWGFWGCFYPPERGKIWGANIFCWNIKLLVHTLLASYHILNLDHFWTRYQLNSQSAKYREVLRSTAKQFGGGFSPLGRAKFLGGLFFWRNLKLLVHTLLTSYHTSNLDHFWACYIQTRSKLRSAK